MVPIGLFDRIALEQAAEASFSVNIPGLIGDNLVTRALAAAGVRDALRVTLEKHIPVGGGLGGGSSDAAAVLRAAMSGALHASRETDWIAAARSLGSDVPFFLTGTAAIIEGTGERVTALGALPPWWVVVVRPADAVATAQAYGMLAASRATNGAPRRPRANSATLQAVDALQRVDFNALQEHLVNDFHDLILADRPLVKRAHTAMLAAGASRALLSGSGSCLFALFPDEAQARNSARAIVRDDCIADIFVAPLVSDEAWR
jgi:4-diphosphocytidyl-2-C-methyl-D-erythritol kinase